MDRTEFCRQLRCLTDLFGVEDAIVLLNEYGDNSFGTGSWCSEQFPTGPRNCLFPDRVNDCEAYDLATGACATSLGQPWTVLIRIAPTRFAACGF